MKNLKTGNYTEVRVISDGFHLRCGELNMTNLGYAKVPSNKVFVDPISHSITKLLCFSLFMLGSAKPSNNYINNII